MRPQEFDAFGLAQEQSREMFEESLEIIRRIFADEIFSHRGAYYAIEKSFPLAPGLVQKPHPPFLISAQSAPSLRFAAENDFPFAQIDALIEECERDQQIYRAIQAANGHPPSKRLIVTREIYVADTDAQAQQEALPYLRNYWNLWKRYTDLAEQGRMPDSYEYWRGTAPRLQAMDFEELSARGLVMIGGPETVARKIIEHGRRLDLYALACVFKFGAMPQDLTLNSMRRFADAVMPRIAAAGLASAAA